jgi:type I restriction enzyme S subunit
MIKEEKNHKNLKITKISGSDNIPELRFPEFVNDGEWVEMQLGDSLLRNPEYGINAPAVPFSNKLPTYLRITDISEDGRFLLNEKVSVAREVTEDNYLSDGDIVLARTGASVGKSYKYRNEDGRLVFAGFLIRLKPDSNKLNSDFLFQFLTTNQYWKWVSFISARSGQPGINATEYSSLPVCLPKPKEQQKIASCLSSLDEVIAAHSQKLELLKDHKKGLMQNLFPHPSTSSGGGSVAEPVEAKVPKYRFKEFENDGEWVEKKLGDIGNITSGGTPNRSTSEYWNGNIPWISTTLIDFNIINKANEYITETGLQNSSAKIFPKNTILMAMYGQGKTRGKVAILGIDAATNQACAAIMLNIKHNTEFVFQYLSANYDEIRRMSNSGGQENLSGGLIEIIPISIPKNLKEQQKIASCLSSLDALIAAQAAKIEQLKLHKKGLMQGLFPKTV